MNAPAPQKKPSLWRYVKRLFLALICVLMLGVIYWQDIPLTSIIEREAKSFLAASYGIELTSLHIETLTLSQLTIKDISLGKGDDFTADSLTAEYALPKLSYPLPSAENITIKSIVIENTTAHLYQTNNHFVLRGLEPLFTAAEDTTKNTRDSILFNAKAIKSVAPKAISAKQLSLSGEGGDWSFSSLLNIDITTDSNPHIKTEAPSISADYLSNTIKLKNIKTSSELLDNIWKTSGEIESATLSSPNNDYSISAQAIQSDITIDAAKNAQTANIVANALTLTGLEAISLPPMQLSSHIKRTHQQITAQFDLSDIANTHQIAGEITVPTDTNTKTTLSLKQARLPWGDGTLSLQPTSLSVPLSNITTLAVDIHDVQLNALFALLGEGKVSGTGRLSGTLPISYHPNGRIALQESVIQASESGTISISPALLAGKGAQIEVARSILENFHYTQLKINISSDENDRSHVVLALQGNNPKAFDGRQVNLNITLTGEILPLIQQSILPINNLKQLLSLQGTS